MPGQCFIHNFGHSYRRAEEERLFGTIAHKKTMLPFPYVRTCKTATVLNQNLSCSVAVWCISCSFFQDSFRSPGLVDGRPVDIKKENLLVTQNMFSTHFVSLYRTGEKLAVSVSALEVIPEDELFDLLLDSLPRAPHQTARPRLEIRDDHDAGVQVSKEKTKKKKTLG